MIAQATVRNDSSEFRPAISGQPSATLLSAGSLSIHVAQRGSRSLAHNARPYWPPSDRFTD